MYKTLLTNLRRSAKIISAEPIELIYATITDILTLFFSFFVLSFFGKIIEVPLTEFLVNLPNPEKPQSNAILILIIAFIVLYILLYAILSLLQPVAWKIAHKLAYNTKETYKKVTMHFLRINIYLILLLASINLYQDVFYTINTITGIIVINKTFLNISYQSMLVLLLYLATISYSKLLPIKASISFAAKRFLKLFPALLVIALTFVAINYIMVFAAKLHPGLTIILGILLFAPAISFARVYLLLAVKELRE
ncbi:TPA: hypothetical protein HA246_07355 [Candidatus Woesearchaeota archaeon]|nr:hypothetical protein [Candidatus Woesearchaeota archaeon]